MTIDREPRLGSLSSLYRVGIADLATDCRDLADAVADLLEYAHSEDACEHLEDVGAMAEEYADVLEDEVLRLGASIRPGHVAGIAGIVDDTDELLTRIDDPATQDTALLGAATAASYYVLARFGTVACHATHLGFDDIADELGTAVEDFRAATSRLNSFALVCVGRTRP